MEKKAEESTPHNPVEGETPKVKSEVVVPKEIKPEETPEVSKVEVPKEEYEELTKRATVSSQNYERLKKLELEKEELQAQLEERDLEERDNVVLSEVDDETITKLKSDISQIKGELDKSKVIEKYPMLKEVWSEVEKFYSDPENRGMSIQTAAKAFVIENGLMEAPRAGLEKTTGGPKVPVSSGMSVEEIQKLRINDYEKYRKMLKNGQINLK